MPRTDELAYLETEDSCAYCGHKDLRSLTIHPLESTTPKNEDYDNKMVLCHNCHQCHHQGKGPSAEDLSEIKRRLIIKTLTRPGLNALKQAYRKAGVVAMPFLVNHLVEFGYLVQGELMRGEYPEGSTSPSVVIDANYTITTAGKALLEKWELK